MKQNTYCKRLLIELIQKNGMATTRQKPTLNLLNLGYVWEGESEVRRKGRMVRTVGRIYHINQFHRYSNFGNH